MEMKPRGCSVRLLAFLAVLLMLFSLFSACSTKKEIDLITSADQLNNEKYIIAVSQGSSAASVIPECFSKAKIVYTSSDAETYMMLEKGKADAYAYDRITLEYAIATEGLEGFSILDEVYDSIDIAVGVNRKYSDELLPKLNEFIRQIKADGTLDDMRKRWVVKAEGTMPDIPQPESPDPDKVIRVGTAGLVTPMTYYGENNEITGFDIELIKRYAHFANVNVEIEVMGFDALVAGLQSERLHMAFSNLNATEERKEVIDFSEAYLVSEVVLMVRSDRLPLDSSINSLDDIDGKRIGYLMGASHYSDVVKLFPNSELYGFDTFPELIQALKSNRIDAYFTDEPMGRCQINETDGLKMIEDPITDDTYGFIINEKKLELQAEVNAVIKQFKEDGTLERLKNKWILGEGEQKLSFDKSTPTPNGELKIGTVVDAMPMAYRVGENVVGYDIELIYLICAELGYKPVLTEYEFDALLAAVRTREDVIIGCITYTEERAQTMLFTDTTYAGGAVAMVRDDTSIEKDFFISLKESFERTFIREDRWKLIVNGLIVTIELSLLSVLFGTVLGFAFSFALRSKKKLISGIAHTVSIIIDGLPLLVILMVLYYVILAKTSLSAMMIGVIGFTLEFANSVAEMLNTGIKAVDVGQIEAAESMGYSKLMVFKKIIFPQAANQMFGQYSGSVISLIKETSIIGYITVEDLTKAGDIIRSRTYEAFFPLIVTAIIYFIIARIFVFLLSRFAKRLDPKERKREVKGVRKDDQY